MARSDGVLFRYEVEERTLTTDCRNYNVADRAVHIGDSRVYRYRQSTLLQLTDDHTLVAALVEGSHISPEFAARHPLRNMLTRVIGGEKASEPDVLSVEEVDRLLQSPMRMLKAEHTAKLSAERELAALRDAAILELLYSTGARVGEIAGLRRSELDLLSGVVKVRGKGKKERLCPVGGPASRALREYFSKADEIWPKSAPATRSCPVCLNLKGNPLPRVFAIVNTPSWVFSFQTIARYYWLFGTASPPMPQAARRAWSAII